jgi:tyrosyl-tRNA synthetase
MRDIMHQEGKNVPFALLIEELPGTDGTAKMSSFKGTDIRLSEPRESIRERLEAINNTDVILKFMRLLTDIPEDDIGGWERGLKSGAARNEELSRIMANAVLDVLPILPQASSQ